jgi:maltose alpha-D-glucosyltransferase / alpha-amylase
VRAGDKTPIVQILSDTPAIPDGAQWMTFLRNHDELTLEMVTPEVRQWMWQEYAPEPRARLNMGIRRRLLPLLEGNKAKWRLLHALFLSLPGTPIIYYGDEIGMGDNIWLPDRHGVRTPMQWDDTPNAGFSAAQQTYLPVHEEYPQVNVAAQEADPESYLHLTRFLVQTRQSQVALRRGGMVWADDDDNGVASWLGGNTAVLAYHRTPPPAEAPASPILCLFNLSDQPQPYHLPHPATDLLNPTTPLPAGDITLHPWAAHWLITSP